MPDLFLPMPPPSTHRQSSQSWKCREGHDEVGWYGDPVCWFCGREMRPTPTTTQSSMTRGIPYFRR